MRNLGSFVGHLWQAVSSDVTTEQTRREEVKRTVEEKVDGAVTYRRTTIEEVEIREESRE
ncbi:MAG: hypothetical protein AAF432_16685 [Planctomycetota bacterium]